MIVDTFMKKNVISIQETATIGDAADLFAHHHIGTLPVLDTENHLMGILHMSDLLRLVMPDFIQLVDDFDFIVGSLGAFETLLPSPESAAKSVSTLMHEPVSAKNDCGLMLAFALLDHHKLYDLLIVDEQHHLVGLASRVDIGTALLKSWNN